MKVLLLTLTLVILAAGPIRCLNINNDLSLEGDDDDKYETVTAVIEIPRDTHVKYETDEDTGALFVDRFICYEKDGKIQDYPINYGFFPQTENDDGDALDVLLPIPEQIVPHAYLKVRPIGLLQMVDTGEQDDKIVAVPADDKRYEDILEVNDLEKTVLDEMVDWFRNYKKCENKTVTVESEYLPASNATGLLEKAHQTFLTSQKAPATENADIFGRRRY